MKFRFLKIFHLLIIIKIVLLIIEYKYIKNSFIIFDSNIKVNTRLCNHEFEFFQLKIRPTFEKDGIVNFKCKKCNILDSKKLPKLKEDNYIVNKNAYIMIVIILVFS